MKKKFEIVMNKEGQYTPGITPTGLYVTVEAETEFEAVQKAKQLHPGLEPARIRVK